MKRYINQMNVSITTNRTCNLKCKHCYISPELFKNKNKLSQENLENIIKFVHNLKKVDTNLEEIEWEVLGGETTLMPFEWWEKNLPYLLNEIKNINETYGTRGNLNFLTNLIIKDERFLFLFNKYGKHPNFSLYTSWEPDTERFGKNNEKLVIWENNLKKLVNVREKILDIIFTKKIISLGAKYIFDNFTKLGITDFSFKMISPFGSGKTFYDDNMCSFEDIENFLLDFREININSKKNITFTPMEEILNSFYNNKSFQCNGNFYYDLSIEPEGFVTFNANQTTNEAVLPFNKLLIGDENIEFKILFENTRETFNKLELLHNECNNCKFLTYCNRGWYHYKIMPEKIIKFNKKSCPGFKKLWEINDNNHYRKPILNKINNNSYDDNLNNYIDENSIIISYNNYFENIKNILNKNTTILIKENILFGKNILERILFYNSLNINIDINENLFESLSYEDKNKIIKNIVFTNYKIKVIKKDLFFKNFFINKEYYSTFMILKQLTQKKYVLNDTNKLLNNIFLEQYLFILKNMNSFIDYEKNHLNSVYENIDINYYDLVYFNKHLLKYFYLNIKNIPII